MSNDLSLYLELKKQIKKVRRILQTHADALSHLITQFEVKTTAIQASVAEIQTTLVKLERKEDNIMATLDEILSDVQAESTLIGSISQLIAGLQVQLNDVLAGNLPPAVQQKVDAIFQQVEANKQALAEAAVANTPQSDQPVS